MFGSETSGIRNPKKMWAVRERGVAVVGDGGAALLPEMREMAERMRAIAEEEGLERVEDDAVALMQAGLHAHLLRLIRSAVPVQETTAFVVRLRFESCLSCAPHSLVVFLSSSLSFLDAWSVAQARTRRSECCAWRCVAHSRLSSSCCEQEWKGTAARRHAAPARKIVVA